MASSSFSVPVDSDYEDSFTEDNNEVSEISDTIFKKPALKNPINSTKSTTWDSKNSKAYILEYKLFTANLEPKKQGVEQMVILGCNYPGCN